MSPLARTPASLGNDDTAITAIATQLESTSLEDEPPPHVFVDQIIFNHLIHEIIFSHLTPLEFLRLAKTCRLVYAVVQTFITRTFNINRALSRFFSDPIAFRSLQARTGTLISGSFALQFFDRTFYSESDLDLYVHPQFKQEVALWFPQNGYQFVPGRHQRPDLEETIRRGGSGGWTGDISDIVANSMIIGSDWLYAEVSNNIDCVYTFAKLDDPNLRVQCIVAGRAPLEVILAFHSSKCPLSTVVYTN